MRETALITGGANRIGKEIALLLSVLGYDIALHFGQSRYDAQTALRYIEHNGVSVKLFQCDLASEKQTARLIQSVKKHFPRLRLLVNSASIFEKSNFSGINRKSLNRHFAVNFEAPCILSFEFARLCQEGQIINILDTHITKNKTSYLEYLSSKKALAQLTQLTAVRFAPHIRVNAIAPGLILPPKNMRDDYLDRLAKKIPLKRRGKPSQIAQTVQFLTENDYVTGQIIFVDGGEHLL